MLNLPRMRAMRIFEMTRAIGLVMSDSDDGSDLFAALGQPVSHAGGSSGFSSWRQDRLASFRNGRP